MIGAVDIGGTKIAAGMVDQMGRLLARQECPTDPGIGWKEAVKRIASLLRQTLAQTGGQLIGIGIGCTGPVYPDTGVIGDVKFLPGWEGANLAEAFSQEFGVPAAIENDANASALGEWAWGAGKGSSTFILVTVGTGIGAGLILDGKLYRGVRGSHPEIGHHVIDPAGPACFCGAHGCWESLASGRAMERWAQDHHPQGERRTARQLCLAVEQGDPLAQAAVHRTAHYMGVGLANLITLFSPEMIALGGGLMQSYPLFEQEIRETIQADCGLVPYQEVKVALATLGTQTGLIGAARVGYNRFSKPL